LIGILIFSSGGEALKGPTVRDKILCHLAAFVDFEKNHQVPAHVSQRGIAKAVGIKEKHFSQYVKPMITEGLVLERSSFILGGRQHQKVYFLTLKGRSEADWMINSFRAPKKHSSLVEA